MVLVVSFQRRLFILLLYPIIRHRLIVVGKLHLHLYGRLFGAGKVEGGEMRKVAIWRRGEVISGAEYE